MCCKLCSIYQRTVIIAISVAGPFIGWSIELHCLNIFLILLQFGKENEKKTMNLTKHCFFLCCICWDCSFSIAEFSISQSCLCLHFFTVYKQDNYLHNGLMGHSNNLGNIKVKVTLKTRKPASPSICRTKLSNFFYYIFFLFKRERGSCHSLGTCLLHL